MSEMEDFDVFKLLRRLRTPTKIFRTCLRISIREIIGMSVSKAISHLLKMLNQETISGGITDLICKNRLGRVCLITYMKRVISYYEKEVAKALLIIIYDLMARNMLVLRAPKDHLITSITFNRGKSIIQVIEAPAESLHLQLVFNKCVE